MKVTIDRENCISCGTCYEVCGEVFEEDPDDTWSRISEKFQVGGDSGVGEVPGDLEECVREAEESCPVEVIRVKE